MAFSYEVNPSGGDIHNQAPYWFAAFIRFDTRDTFTRTKMSSLPQNSSIVTPQEAVQERPVLISDNDCIGWSVGSAKTSHTSSCSLQLNSGDIDYVSELASGDWMGFWAFDNKEDFIRVRRAVKNSQQCNGFFDGLKFVGRVESVRRKKTRQAMTGHLTVQYTVNGTGFSEFDAAIYYNPYFKAKYGNDALLWMMDFGGSANNLILGVTRNKGVISSQDALPKLLRICFGVQQSFGSGVQSSESDTEQSLTLAERFDEKQNAALHGTLNKGYLVPETIGSWLGATSTIKGSLSYVDILRTYIGIQTYSGGGTATRDSTSRDLRPFVPDFRSNEQNTYLMNDDLTGEYRVLTMHFDNRPVWGILGTYVNDPIDEMYTCLRVDPNGNVMPTLVVRQNPMSTKWYSENGQYKVTAFTDLPRWKIHTDLIQDEDVGRSNATRFNYLHLMGQDLTGTNVEDNGVVNFVRNPPIVDPSDANRSGLRMFEKQLSANVNEAQYNNNTSPGGKWQEIMADILMGSHLKYSGTIMCKGIQEPICEGDNLEFDGVLYHIERVTHSGSISPFGTREFNTSIQVTNGISLASDSADAEVVYPDLDEHNENDAQVIEREDGIEST